MGTFMMVVERAHVELLLGTGSSLRASPVLTYFSLSPTFVCFLLL